MRTQLFRHQYSASVLCAAIAVANLCMPLALLAPQEAHAAATFGARLAMPNNTLGLTAHWTFDGQDLLTNVKDVSGQGNNATLGSFTSTSSAVTIGTFGQALSFNGTSQYATSPMTISYSQITVSVWFKANSLSGDNPRIVANSHTDSDHKGFQLMVNNGGTTGFFDVGNGSTVGLASWSKSLSTGKWYHYVGTYDGTTVRAYLNGVQVASGAVSGAVAASGCNVNIGRNNCGYTGDWLNGTIDDVRIYNRALSVTEVKQLYTQGSAGSQIQGCGFGTFLPASNQCRGFITSGTTWSVPSDWSSTNTIEAIGAGGNGANGSGSGGGGGAYAKITNQTLTPSSSVTIQIGSGGGGPGSTGDSYLKDNSNTTVLLARGGATPTTSSGGAGGDTAGSVGSTKYAGGAGGGHQFGSGGGGGGSAGPSGAGKAGGLGAYGESGGPGGGGSNGGSSTAGTAGSGYNGNAGGNGTSGTGGGAAGGSPSNSGSPGTVGGGGGGAGVNNYGGAGGSDTSFDATHGAGGGGGSNGTDLNTTASGAGGLYGGGGAGGGHYGSHTNNGGPGAQGLIVITYTPVSSSNSNHLISATISSTPTPPNLSNGLVGHWTFDGADLISNVKDTSVTSNNGHLTGITATSSAAVPGILGQALSFSANNQGVLIPYNAAYNWGSSESVSAWVYLSQTQQAWSRVYEQTGGSGTGLNVEINATNKPQVQINATQITSSNVLQLNRWYLYTETYDGTTAKIYVNGNLDKSQALTGAITNYNETLILGKGAGGVEQFYGSLDDVRLYNRTLSAQEVKQLYTLGK